MTDNNNRLKAIESLIVKNTGLDSMFIEELLFRLESLGCRISSADAWAVGFSAKKTIDSINNACNTAALPDTLRSVAVDRSCGEFLLVKKASGQLLDHDLEPAIKQIQEGEVSVTFKDGIKSEEERLDTLIAYLINAGNSDIIKYRRLSW